jgi:hypothetical protein
MLGELAPVGAVEAILAERIAGLSWRLKRAQRMQDEAFEALLTPDTSSLAVRIGQSFRPKLSETQAETERELAFGRAVVKDFGHERVLDRLLMYERRIEHSLYRTMAELQRLRLVRDLDASPGQPVRSGPVRASEETPDGVTTNTPEEVGRGRPTLDQVEGRLYQEPLDGVTTNAPAGAEKSCKTKPMAPSVDRSQVPDNKEVTESLPAKSLVETKPISCGAINAALVTGEADDRSQGGPVVFDAPGGSGLSYRAGAAEGRRITT